MSAAPSRPQTDPSRDRFPPRAAEAAGPLAVPVAGRLVLLGGGEVLPTSLAHWMARFAGCDAYPDADAVMAHALRGRPRALVLDARGERHGVALAACRRVKSDGFTGILPTVVLVADDATHAAAAFDAGADEVIAASTAAWEVEARLAALLRRSDRDTGVHPTTRLGGTPEIEAELTRRLAAGEAFAACYADLDHFKEFNDRYGYNQGDRIIRMVARLLHDVVKGVAGEDGFVGHIGGDDFLFIVPLAHATSVCEVIVETFELLVPLQYSEPDRRAGYYFGKDRRGQLHRVPLMSLSIGVATTERRRFTAATQVSLLASEMKSYAKAKPGSLFAIDRRNDDAPPASRIPADHA